MVGLAGNSGAEQPGRESAGAVERAHGSHAPGCFTYIAGVYFPGLLLPAGFDGRGTQGVNL
jgi:hypothetical protein